MYNHIRNITMKRPYTRTINLGALAILFFLIASCERPLSDDAVLPSFPSTAGIFDDDFIGMGADFYFPFADAKPNVFSVDITEGFESNSSIRIDVPNANDPAGGYAGAIFRVDGSGRNLTAFDALTFYVKASQGVELGSAGFGLDFVEDKYQVTLNNINVSTNWSKVIIPIPDASVLVEERGVFWFAAGSQGTNDLGYALWFDDMKFEKLGSLGMPRASIENGQTRNVQAYVGSTVNVGGLTQTYGLVNGQNVALTSSQAYYEFESSDTTIAKVVNGEITLVGTGNAEITATLAGNPAIGKLVVESLPALPAAPTPTQPQENVLSLFSESYTSATTINYEPGFGGSTTQADILTFPSGEVLQFSNNNFSGIMFDASPLDATNMEFLHIDAYVENTSTSIGIQIRDIGANKTIETNVFTGFPEGDDADYRRDLNGFQAGEWRSFDIPLAGGIANQKGNLGGIIITGGPNFVFDNIYFYKN
jgi:hypothetical protein